MQQPSTAAGVPQLDAADARLGEGHSQGKSANHDPTLAESDSDLDQDLRSLVDGIAMLGRFESELAEYENSLEDVSARGG